MNAHFARVQQMTAPLTTTTISLSRAPSRDWRRSRQPLQQTTETIKEDQQWAKRQLTLGER